MKKRLTQAEFEHAISNLSRALKPANVEIVKAILVDGRK
ncbi:transcriptional regulator, partial [Salmonella enterica subsp. enterica serovar Kentucky]|nr:transcriptional regulator [Salmonella enterica subsp. enterica serovar Kentucky]